MKVGHHRITNDLLSAIIKKEEYPAVPPEIVYCQSEVKLPTVIPKYVSEPTGYSKFYPFVVMI